MRERFEFTLSTVIGGAMTLILLSRLHEGLSAGELVTFWAAAHMITTATVWWTIDKAQKCRDAWQSNHGKK